MRSWLYLCPLGTACQGLEVVDRDGLLAVLLYACCTVIGDDCPILAYARAYGNLVIRRAYGPPLSRADCSFTISA